MEKNYNLDSSHYFPAIDEAIEDYRKKGMTDKQISIAFGGIYRDNVINYEMFKHALEYLHFEVTEEFDKMSEAERIAWLNKTYK